MWPGGLRQQRVDSSTRHDLPPTSICIRPTDRPIYACRPRLVRGPALSSLPPSLNRYILPPARKISKTPKKIRDVHKNTPPDNQMTNERRVWPGGVEAGAKSSERNDKPAAVALYINTACGAS